MRGHVRVHTARLGDMLPGGSYEALPVAARSLWKGAKNVLFPVQCAGCGRWDTELCQTCAELAQGPVSVGYLEDGRGRPDLELLFLGDYAASLRSIVLAAKHDPHRDLSGFLFDAGQTLGKASARALSRHFDRAESGHPLAPGIWVVPAPSSHARRRKRAEIVPAIAAGVVVGIRSGMTASVKLAPIVALKPGMRGQAGKSAGGRARSRHQAVRGRRRVPQSTLVVVVDDVVATGATMRAVADTLDGHVVQALAVCVA